MTTPTPRRPDDLVAALADAFDTVAPTERAAAEQELLDAGLDPAAIAARFAAITSSTVRRTGVQSSRRSAASAAAPSRRRWWGVAIAAALVAAIAASLLAGRTSPERVARTAPAPRAIEPPSSHSAAPSVGASSDAQRPVGGEPLARGTAQSSITPAADAPESAAETTAIAGAAAELKRVLRMDESLPAIIAASVARHKLALREITVTSEMIESLQSPAFVAASFGNDGRYAVDPKTCRLMAAGAGASVEDRFGLPFPTIARDGRDAGCQIMWNVEATFAAGGGHRGRASVCTSIPQADEQCSNLSFASLSFAGRMSGPIPNPNNLRAANYFRVEGEPDPDRGKFILRAAPLEGIADRWFYIPDLRRVRRLTRELYDDEQAQIPSGLAFAASQRNCYDANPEAYRWTFLGTQEVLAPLSGEGIQLSPTIDDSDGAAPAAETLTAMRRQTVVVAATEIASPDRRLVLYIDAGLFRPYWKIEFVGAQAKAAYACAAAWGADGEMVAPLSSSVIRFDAEGTPTQRFTPSGEVFDQTLRGDVFTIGELMAVAPR